jgi:hypothetical protein
MASVRRPNEIRVGTTVAYQGECEEKVVFSGVERVEANSDATQQYKCGRSIVTYRGAAYGTRRLSGTNEL